MINTLGVCSWSLQSQGVDALLQRVAECGVARVQIALGGLLDRPDDVFKLREAVENGVIALCSGMLATIGEDYSSLESIRSTGGLRPDEHWNKNLELAQRTAELASDLGLGLVTLHAGFIPEDDARLHDVMVDRVCRVAEVFNARGVTLGLETGQETAETLLGLLSTIAPRVRVGVNFDPANMILYGMGDPNEAMRVLREHIVQVHMKDALASDTPGDWGTEVVAGAGQVDWNAFFEIVEGLAATIDVVIEREAGDTRIEDIRTAAALARQHIGRVRA